MRLGKMANGVINATAKAKAKANGCVGLVSTSWKLSPYLELYMNKKIRVLQYSEHSECERSCGVWACGWEQSPLPTSTGSTALTFTQDQDRKSPLLSQLATTELGDSVGSRLSSLQKGQVCAKFEYIACSIDFYHHFSGVFSNSEPCISFLQYLGKARYFIQNALDIWRNDN